MGCNYYYKYKRKAIRNNSESVKKNFYKKNPIRPKLNGTIKYCKKNDWWTMDLNLPQLSNWYVYSNYRSYTKENLVF